MQQHNYTQTHTEFNIGPTRFRFPTEPREDDGTRERLDNLRDALPDLLAKVDAGKTEAARRRSVDRKDRTGRDDYEAAAIWWAKWKAGRLGIDLSGMERAECAWQPAKLTAMAQPRTPTARDPRPYVDSIDQVRFVRFYRECKHSGGGFYGAPRVVTGGELIAEIEIAGWDHRAIPAAEGPVSYLYDFQDRADRAAELLHVDRRFREMVDVLPEAASIPPEERTRATADNLADWARMVRVRNGETDRHRQAFEFLTGDKRNDYGPAPDAWDRFAFADSDDEREAARLEIALYRLYCSEGADGRPRPFTGDDRLPALDRAKRKALTVERGGRYRSEACASTCYPSWDWLTIASADKAWHDGETMREQFEVRRNADRTRWAYLRWAWSPKGRTLVDVAETTKAETAQAWCAALVGPESVTVKQADPERVAAYSERGCFVAVERGCYIRHVGTFKACQALAGGDVMVLAFPGGWHLSDHPSPLYANARAWLAGERQRITTLALARWERTRANAHAYTFSAWVKALGFSDWVIVRRLSKGAFDHRRRIGIAEDAYQKLQAEHREAVRVAVLVGREIPPDVVAAYRHDWSIGHVIRDRAA